MGACVSTDRSNSIDGARDPRVPRFERPRRAGFSGRTAADLHLDRIDIDDVRCVEGGNGPDGHTGDLAGERRAEVKGTRSPRKAVDEDEIVQSPSREESPRAVAEFVGDDDSTEDSEERTIRWQRGELVGSGGFGRVYVGLDLDTGGMLAVKQIAIAPRISRVVDINRATGREDALADENDRAADESVRRIEQEVALMRRLKHPNIVSYLGTERTREDVFTIFMEYVSGGSIHSLLQRFGSFGESVIRVYTCLLYTSPSPRDATLSRMPSSA